MTFYANLELKPRVAIETFYKGKEGQNPEAHIGNRIWYFENKAVTLFNTPLRSPKVHNIGLVLPHRR